MNDNIAAVEDLRPAGFLLEIAIRSDLMGMWNRAHTIARCTHSGTNMKAGFRKGPDRRSTDESCGSRDEDRYLMHP